MSVEVPSCQEADTCYNCRKLQFCTKYFSDESIDNGSYRVPKE